MPIIVINIPPEKVLKAPAPNSSGLADRIPARIMIHKPKRTSVSGNIWDKATNSVATEMTTDTARITIKIPSERTATGFLGIKIHTLYVS